MRYCEHQTEVMPSLIATTSCFMRQYEYKKVTNLKVECLVCEIYLVSNSLKDRFAGKVIAFILDFYLLVYIDCLEITFPILARAVNYARI